MKTAIAIWNYCWNPENIMEWIVKFAESGFEAVSFNPRQFGDGRTGCLPEISALLTECNLTATLHGKVSGNSDLMDTVVQALSENLYAATMDPRRIQTSIGHIHNAAAEIDAIQRLLNLTSDSDIRVAIEDFPLDRAALDFYMKDLDDIYSDSRTGILIDVGHMHLRMNQSSYFRNQSVPDYFRSLPCPLVEVHLHDNNGKQDQHGHFGFGGINFAEVASALKEIRFNGVCTIEIAPGFHDSTPEESLPRAIESLQTWRHFFE